MVAASVRQRGRRGRAAIGAASQIPQRAVQSAGSAFDELSLRRRARRRRHLLAGPRHPVRRVVDEARRRRIGARRHRQGKEDQGKDTGHARDLKRAARRAKDGGLRAAR